MPFLSIIIPIYNVQQYLEQCILSVFEQSFTDYELILVDDGSSDHSGKLCDWYATKDPSVKVIHKKNGGLSDARNAGLKLARGKYILFLDSDDYMKARSLSKMMKLVKENEKVDLFIIPMIKTYPDQKQSIDYLPLNNTFEIIDRKEMYQKITSSISTFWFVGKNIFRRSIIQENKLKFKKNLIGAEDCEFFMNYVRCSNTFFLTNIPMVHYRVGREGSITQVMSGSAILGQLFVFYHNYKIFKWDHIHKNNKVKSFFANKYMNTITLLEKVNTIEECNLILDYIKKHKDILRASKGMKYQMAKLMWRIFGYYQGSIFIRKIKKWE